MIVFNDPHFSAVAPASRKSNYTQCILNKLREIVEFANDQKVHYLACTGDWFISKRPEATPYWLAAEIESILADFKGIKFTAIGNHDVQSGIGSITRSPLYLIAKAADISMNVNGGFLYEDLYAQFVVVNYDADMEGFQTLCTVFDEGVVRIVLAHTPIIPPFKLNEYPQQYVEQAVKATDLVGYADYIFYGDIHDYHGIYSLDSKRGGTTFCNVGAIARNSATEIDSKRQVKVALLEISDNKSVSLQEVDLENVLLVDEVFNIHIREEKKLNEAEMDKFIGSLDTSSLSFGVLTPDILKFRLGSESALNSYEKKLGLEAIDETV